jgi:transcription elongation factor SPT5
MGQLYKHPAPPIASAFVRPSIPGKLYVEAACETQVQRGLQNISNIQLHKISRVAIDEALALLNLNVRFFAVDIGDLVRLETGLYRGDLAVVLNVENTYARIALIPRLRIYSDGTKGKRKRRDGRPTRRLFDENEVIKIPEIDSVAQHSLVFRFEGQTFKNGLLELDISLEDLEQKRADPSADELYEFIRIAGRGHESVAESVAQALSRVAAASIQAGDRVQVISGESWGNVGFVEEVGDGEVKLYISNAKASELDTIMTPNTTVAKHFIVKDFVKVRSGAGIGTSGWVVHCHDGMATIYVGTAKEEVSVHAT